MDLIYARPDRTDLGVLRDYEFDLAYGEDENDFTLSMALKNHCCEDDYLVYMVDTQNGYEQPTEYGGIIDAITVDTEKQTVVYSGRTWQGILEEKVIEPDDGYDYRTVSGDAHEILTELFSVLGLQSIFTVSNPTSDIQIPPYQFARYVDAYKGISAMLTENGGKLKVVYDNDLKKIVVSAIWIVDYSQRDEWDSSQITFSIKKTKNPVNHLVCLGQGDLKDRAVIHLFLDDNGGLQPYATKDSPLEDADYILDKRNQQLFGVYEVAETYDFSSAEIKTNYVRLSTRPADWSWNYSQYYKADGDSFALLEAEPQEQLMLLPSAPADWSDKYASYFKANGDSVEGVETENYVQLTKAPPDWAENYGNYYVHFWDGTQYIWQSVNGVTWYEYVPQTKEPSDWLTNYSSYYKLKVKTEVVKDKNGRTVMQEDGITPKTIKVGDGYETVSLIPKGNTEVVPTWKKKKYYTRYSHQKAPKFVSGLDKWRKDKVLTAPVWQANTYYTKQTVLTFPAWATNKYYRLAEDRFAELVEGGIKHLTDLTVQGDDIDIDLNLLGEYDIGDIVGASEQTTGIEVWQAITKKIISITRKGKQITYKIGDV